MKWKITHSKQYLIMLFAVSLFFLFCFVCTIQAATMPGYERFQPITTKINAPTAVALDASENIYVVESSNNKLLTYSQDGQYLRTLRGLDKPISIAVSNDGRIFVGNDGRGDVEVYDADLTFLYKLGSGDKEFSRPGAIAVDSAGNVYVADSKGDKIKVYNPDSSYKFSLGSSGSKDGQFHFPTSIAIDELSGEIIISDLQLVETEFGSTQGARIQVFDLNGGFKRGFGNFGFGKGKLAKPLGVDVDKEGRIYVSDSYQNIVQVFDSNGIFLGTIYDLDNPMRTPLGIAIGQKTNRLFIASLNTSRVEVYDVIHKPRPDIKANNADGPIGITTNEDCSITVSLNPGDRTGEAADWWLAVDTSLGLFCYNASKDSWVSGNSVTYQGPLFNLAPTGLGHISGLPPGTYTFYFGVDINMDGSLDDSQLYYDSVEVNITE
ncbi:MAG: hypothetical protein A3G93_15380 [Nitrospinae bacterium RIFCSPLOWO2_12_FULL_45_22]|nr:MAG: hypothetical protein A3G93_15380 [Nitrospinae bacterium RIFCSPLOWO2_12_FULL_45_22]